MTSAAPSPRLARAASRVEAGTPGATGQTLRRAGRSSPFSTPPSLGRAMSLPRSEGCALPTRRGFQFTATSPFKLMAVFPVGATFNHVPPVAPAGFSFDEAGMRC